MKTTIFTTVQFEKIKVLLTRLEHSSSPTEKKGIRAQLRKNGYYISDFDGANTVRELQSLIDCGIIKVSGTAPVRKEKATTPPCKAPVSTSVNAGIVSFPPIEDNESEVLILGTMPGKESLATGEYYANNRNMFWKIIQELYNGGKDFASYEEKEACLKKNHIALWDTLEACDRVGSTDSGISNEVPNDLNGFLRQHPSIKRIVFNGKKPATYYSPKIPYAIALSTSPANASYSQEEKIEAWRDCLMA